MEIARLKRDIPRVSHCAPSAALSATRYKLNCCSSLSNSTRSTAATDENDQASSKLQRDGMKVQLAQMTQAAIKVWQFVARYTTKTLLCQGVDGDMAMARNSRRVFADKKMDAAMGAHIAFDDTCKLITPDKTDALYMPPAPRVQVVALANWESAPTFVLDKDFPKASSDGLLNKCNPFLSGKRRAQSDDDMASVSTATISENDVADLELDMVVVEEVDIVDEQKPAALIKQTSDSEVKLATDWTPTDSPVQKTEAAWEARWVQVGHGRYEKYLANGETWAKAN